MRKLEVRKEKNVEREDEKNEKKILLDFTEARTSFPLFLLFFSSFIVLFTPFLLVLFPLSSIRNSRGNRARISRTHSSHTCVCHASSVRTCVSLECTHACSHFARALHRRWRLVWISHEARNDKRTSFLSDRSRIFPALRSLVENITRPTLYFPFFLLLFRRKWNLTVQQDISSLYVAKTSLQTRIERSQPLFSVKWRRFLCKYPDVYMYILRWKHSSVIVISTYVVTFWLRKL